MRSVSRLIEMRFQAHGQLLLLSLILTMSSGWGYHAGNSLLRDSFVMWNIAGKLLQVTSLQRTLVVFCCFCSTCELGWCLIMFGAHHFQVSQWWTPKQRMTWPLCSLLKSKTAQSHTHTQNSHMTRIWLTYSELTNQRLDDFDSSSTQKQKRQRQSKIFLVKQPHFMHS